ncbi:MAG: haloacid dehalogenase type II [Chloroflexi bacterium]|nr:haloacid dehalogenase type II [Chloroflexota bacterium]
MNPVFENCKALTFDLFGTVLDLGGSLTPHLKTFLDARGVNDGSSGSGGIDPAAMWQQLRYRQRIEQYQDTLVELGHTGYLETARKAFVYVSRLNRLDPTPAQVETFMSGWQELSPFPECVEALDRLGGRYRLIALSNGNPWFLDHLVKNRIKYDFDDVMSVEDVGSFKPAPGVYRRAARNLGMEPSEIIMISANSFDVMGARTCGFRGAYVNRYDLPFEDTHKQYEPDVTVKNFAELADALL